MPIPSQLLESILDDLAPLRSASLGARATLKALLMAALTRMDVVSREEFEIQAQILQRTREKIDQLEAQLAELRQSEQEPTQASRHS